MSEEEKLPNPVSGVNVNYPVSRVSKGDKLIKEIVLDIGKEIVSHIELQYPAMFESVGSSAKLSIRNFIYNEVMGSIQVNDEEKIRARLERRKKLRRKLKRMRNEVMGKDALT